MNEGAGSSLEGRSAEEQEKKHETPSPPPLPPPITERKDDEERVLHRLLKEIETFDGYHPSSLQPSEGRQEKEHIEEEGEGEEEEQQDETGVSLPKGQGEERGTVSSDAERSEAERRKAEAFLRSGAVAEVWSTLQKHSRPRLWTIVFNSTFLSRYSAQLRCAAFASLSSSSPPSSLSESEEGEKTENGRRERPPFLFRPIASVVGEHLRLSMDRLLYSPSGVRKGFLSSDGRALLSSLLVFLRRETAKDEPLFRWMAPVLASFSQILMEFGDEVTAEELIKDVLDTLSSHYFVESLRTHARSSLRRLSPSHKTACSPPSPSSSAVAAVARQNSGSLRSGLSGDSGASSTPPLSLAQLTLPRGPAERDRWLLQCFEHFIETDDVVFSLLDLLRSLLVKTPKRVHLLLLDPREFETSLCLFGHAMALLSSAKHRKERERETDQKRRRELTDRSDDERGELQSRGKNGEARLAESEDEKKERQSQFIELCLQLGGTIFTLLSECVKSAISLAKDGARERPPGDNLFADTMADTNSKDMREHALHCIQLLPVFSEALLAGVLAMPREDSALQYSLIYSLAALCEVLQYQEASFLLNTKTRARSLSLTASAGLLSPSEEPRSAKRSTRRLSNKVWAFGGNAFVGEARRRKEENGETEGGGSILEREDSLRSMAPSTPSSGLQSPCRIRPEDQPRPSPREREGDSSGIEGRRVTLPNPLRLFQLSSAASSPSNRSCRQLAFIHALSFLADLKSSDNHGRQLFLSLCPAAIHAVVFAERFLKESLVSLQSCWIVAMVAGAALQVYPREVESQKKDMPSVADRRRWDDVAVQARVREVLNSLSAPIAPSSRSSAYSQVEGLSAGSLVGASTAVSREMAALSLERSASSLSRLPPWRPAREREAQSGPAKSEDRERAGQLTGGNNDDAALDVGSVLRRVGGLDLLFRLIRERVPTEEERSQRLFLVTANLSLNRLSSALDVLRSALSGLPEGRSGSFELARPAALSSLPPSPKADRRELRRDVMKRRLYATFPSVQLPEFSRINLQNLRIEEATIGEGAFGKVYPATLFRGRNIPVAVKQVCPLRGGRGDFMTSGFFHSALFRNFEREARILGPLHCSHIVRMYGYVVDEKGVGLVLEKCEGSVLDLLKSDRELDWITRLDILVQAAEGVAYLHAYCPIICHRDLKTANLLYNTLRDGSFQIKVTDFGLSTRLQSSQLMTGRRGTPGWVAPEVIQARPYDTACDVYSFGIVMWELLTRSTPYAEKALAHLKVGKELDDFIVKGGRPTVPNFLKDAAVEEEWRREREEAGEGESRSSAEEPKRKGGRGRDSHRKQTETETETETEREDEEEEEEEEEGVSDSTAVEEEEGEAEYSPSLWKGLPLPLQRRFAGLMQRCWAKNPRERPSFVQVRDELVEIASQLPSWRETGKRPSLRR